MTEHRYDTNWDNTSQNNTMQSNQMIAMVIFVALGIGVAVALAAMFAPKPKKKPGLAGEIEERINSMEKELSSLSKRIQERIKELT